MRILLVTSEDETIGGVAYVVGNLAQQLKSRGHEIVFLNSGNTLLAVSKTTKWGFPGIELNLQMPFGDRHPIISLTLFLFRFIIGLSQLIRLLRKHRIQIVNIHYPAECFVYFALCRKILPFRLITSVHGADLFPDGTARPTYSKAITLLLNSSDRIVAPSKAHSENVAEIFPQLRRKIVWIHNGIDLAALNRACAGLGSWSRVSYPYILCISAYKQQKAIDVLIRAFKSVQEIDPTVRLVIVGEGPLRKDCEELAISFGINAQIEFLGPRAWPEVIKLLFGCKIFVLPSRFETFGIVILEAMACEKPIVATTAGGIPEIIENGSNGILIEPDNDKALADALITVLQDETLRTNIAVKGCSTVSERFRIQNSGIAYENLFVGLIANQAQKKAA